MIEGIKEIGNIILSEAPKKFLESLVLNVPSEKKGKKQYIVIIEFDTQKETISFDHEEIKKETVKKYLWIGNASSNNPQDRFTTSNLEYLVSQTIPNLSEFLESEKLKDLLEKVKEKFYYDQGPQERQKERYHYVWNIEKLEISSKNMRELEEKALKDPKKMANLVSKEIYEYLKKEKRLSKNEIALFTLKIDGQLMVNQPKYRKYLENSIVEELFSDETTGVCHLCQKEGKITSNMTKFDFKYYITDKIGFSAELKKLEKEGFLENFTLCKECYMNLLVGESFIKNNLRSYLAGTNLYIIPKFIFGPSFFINKLKRWVEYINISFNSTRTLDGLGKFQDSLEDYLEFEEEKNNFILNILFYKKAQSELKILKLIKDVPPSRLDMLREVDTKVHDISVRLLGENDKWYLNLEKMYYLFPVRISSTERGGKEVVDYKKVLEFYDSLFSSKPISYKFLIQQFVELACVYRFEKFNSYNIGKTDSDLGLVYSMLESNLLLLYLKKLNLLEGGKTMVEEINTTLLSEELKMYIEAMGYGEEQIALFLLGYLIGKIGNAQWSKGNSNKPILNKIIYQGMNISKILRLTNDIFEKLKQYKSKDGKSLLTYNEAIFAEYKKLLDKKIKDWELSDQQNVFYVLSGYAYNTYKAITSKKDKNRADEKPEENKQKEE